MTARRTTVPRPVGGLFPFVGVAREPNVGRGVDGNGGLVATDHVWPAARDRAWCLHDPAHGQFFPVAPFAAHAAAPHLDIAARAVVGEHLVLLAVGVGADEIPARRLLPLEVGSLKWVRVGGAAHLVVQVGLILKFHQLTRWDVEIAQ